MNDDIRTEIETIEEIFPETRFDRLIANIGTFFFIVMLLMVWVQVFIRYIATKVGFSLPWTEEVSRYLFFVLTILGSAIAIRVNGHIRILTVYNMFKPKIKTIFDIITYILMSIFVIVGINGGWKMSRLMWNSPTGSITVLKMGYLYLIFTVLLILMGVNVVRGLICKIQEASEYKTTELQKRGN